MLKLPIIETTSPSDMIAAIKRHRHAELAIQRLNYKARMSDFNRTLNMEHYHDAQAIKPVIERLEQRIIELEN